MRAIFGRPSRLYGPLQSGIDALADHAALELGKGARDLEHQLSGRRGRVDRLLIEIEPLRKHGSAISHGLHCGEPRSLLVFEPTIYERHALGRGNNNWSLGKKESTTLSTMEARQPIKRSRSSAKITTERMSCRSYANGVMAYGSMQRPTDGLKWPW